MASVVLASMMLVSVPAVRADIILPDQEACGGKQAGEECSIQGQTGACVEFDRCRPLPDGGESCSKSLRCDPNAKPTADDKPAQEDPTTNSDPGDSGADQGDKGGDEEKKPEDVKATEKSGSDRAGSCAQSGLARGEDLGMLASLLLGVGLFGALRRRK